MDEAVKAELARLRDEDNRQNHRIDDLEQSVKAIQDLTISVHALAQDMRQMLSELKDQGTRLERFDGRLEALEQQPARRWQRMSDKVLDTAVGLLAGAVITGLAMLGVMAFVVSTITKVVKSWPGLDKLPTSAVVIVLSLVLCPVTFVALMAWMDREITWYMVFACMIGAFIVALVAMDGWERLKEIWDRTGYREKPMDKS